MKKLDQLIRPHLRQLVPYSSARDEYEGSQGVFLDANENSVGSIGMGHWNRYPDPYQREVKKILAATKNISVDQVFLGNGSDEPIDLMIRAFCEPAKDEIMIFPPTYGMYKVSADINNVDVREIQLTPEFQLDMAAIRDAMHEKIKLVFVCSPNNPTGNSMRLEDLEEILRISAGIVVLDEAYIDFSYKSSLIDRLSEYENLVILQTFSKAWGLASLRAGMAFAHPDILSILTKIKPPYNLSGPVQEMIVNALNYKDMKESWVEKLNREREKLFNDLQSLPIVRKVYPSDGNFLLVKFDDAKSVFEELINERIIVRDRSRQPGCDGCLRITVGVEGENKQLISTLKRLTESSHKEV